MYPEKNGCLHLAWNPRTLLLDPSGGLCLFASLFLIFQHGDPWRSVFRQPCLFMGATPPGRRRLCAEACCWKVVGLFGVGQWCWCCMWNSLRKQKQTVWGWGVGWDNGVNVGFEGLFICVRFFFRYLRCCCGLHICTFHCIFWLPGWRCRMFRRFCFGLLVSFVWCWGTTKFMKTKLREFGKQIVAGNSLRMVAS